jgi:hypothetical protein
VILPDPRSTLWLKLFVLEAALPYSPAGHGKVTGCQADMALSASSLMTTTRS